MATIIPAQNILTNLEDDARKRYPQKTVPTWAHHWGTPMDPARKLNEGKKGGEEWKKSILIYD
jgi:hypothetical protein